MKWKQNMVTIFRMFRFCSAVALGMWILHDRPQSTALCFNCPHKNSQRSYERPRKNAYLEICRLTSAFKFQIYRVCWSASVYMGPKCYFWLITVGDVQICLSLDQGIFPFKTASDGTADFSQKMMQQKELPS